MTLIRRNHPNPVREQWDRTLRWCGRFRRAIAAGDGDAGDFVLVVLQQFSTMHDWMTKALQRPTLQSAAENPAGPWGRKVTKPGAERCTVRVTWAGAIVYPAMVDPAWGATGSVATGRYAIRQACSPRGRCSSREERTTTPSPAPSSAILPATRALARLRPPARWPPRVSATPRACSRRAKCWSRGD